MYNIPEQAIDDAMQEKEVESGEEEEYEEELENELEMEDGGPEFVEANESDTVILSTKLSNSTLIYFYFQESESGQKEAIDVDSSFESSEGSDVEVGAFSS